MSNNQEEVGFTFTERGKAEVPRSILHFVREISKGGNQKTKFFILSSIGKMRGEGAYHRRFYGTSERPIPFQ